MKSVTVVWADGSGRTTFTVREYVNATHDVYLHDIDRVTGQPFELETNQKAAKMARIPMCAVAAVFYE